MEEDSAKRPEGPCPNPACDGIQFRLNGRVRRSYKSLIERVIYTEWFWLSVWFCTKCGRSFRKLPKGLPRHKRYMQDEICHSAKTFLEADTVRYSTAARTGDLPWVHEGKVADEDSSEAEKMAESASGVAGSTVFHWISALALSLPRVRDRLEGEESLVRWAPGPLKARSQKRRGILKDAYLVLSVLLKGYTIDFATGLSPPSQE